MWITRKEYQSLCNSVKQLKRNGTGLEKRLQAVLDVCDALLTSVDGFEKRTGARVLDVEKAMEDVFGYLGVDYDINSDPKKLVKK